MKTALGSIFANPISAAITKAVGGNALIGSGVAAIAARWALRSVPGMIALGAIALGLKYYQSRQADSAEDKAPLPREPHQNSSMPFARQPQLEDA